MRRSCLVLLVAVAVALCCASCQTQSIPPGVNALRDVEYHHVDGKTLRLDLYRPEQAAKPLPLIVWIHGGGWIAGDKELCPALIFATRGYAVASVEYRLTPAAVYPAQLQDCKAAIRYLRSHAAEYGIDPDRIGVWGASAGGHLVALLGVTAGEPRVEGAVPPGAPSCAVQAVCDWYGPTDFPGLLAQLQSTNPEVRKRVPSECRKLCGKDSAVTLLLGGPLEERPQQAALASPIAFVKGPYARPAATFPPFLIMHGDRDPIVPLDQSLDFNQALQAAGARSELIIYPGAGHDGLGGLDSLKVIETFFAAALKNPPSAPGTEISRR